MRRRIVAGNWKMNLTFEEANALYSSLNSTKIPTNTEVIIIPGFLSLATFLDSPSQNLSIGAQNFYPKESGAYTGEVSISQLKAIGVTHALVGHSERRMVFGETNELLKDKVDACLAHDIVPIFCCGEPLEVREQSSQNQFVKQQLNASLFHLNSEQIRNTIIAYEPVWAIGTGRTASSAQAEEMHAEIRSWIENKYGTDVAQQMTILYGGSCNESNAAELFACQNVDGGLIGGAALKSESFISIINA